MKTVIRVLIVDDHPLMRSGIAAEVSAEDDIMVVASASDGVEGLAMYRRHQPNVTLIDLRMPRMSGQQLIEEIHKIDVKARIVVLTTSSCDAHIEKAFRSGAAGYLLKHMLRGELIETIRAVNSGRRIIPREIALVLANRDLNSDITARELQILKQVALGRSNKEIADDLSISEYTVKGHLKVILQKLEANDRTHAVTIAVQRGFLEL